MLLGILMTVVNIALNYKRGRVAGPDPWKGNTLEWFVPSPPPVNNFDTIPRVRIVEPMRDIRRQIERETGVKQKTGGTEQFARADGREHDHQRCADRPRQAAARQLVADYVELTKPKVQTLLLFTTVTTMEIAGSPSVSKIAITCLGGYLSAGGAGAVNHYYDRDIDAKMKRTASRPIPSGRVVAAGRADLRDRALGAVVRAAVDVREPAVGVARAGRFPRLRRGLHDLAQAPYPAEHRDRRRRRRRAAARRVGRGARLAGVDGGLPVRDRLLLDPAPLLGAQPADEGRVREGRRCR